MVRNLEIIDFHWTHYLSSLEFSPLLLHRERKNDDPSSTFSLHFLCGLILFCSVCCHVTALSTIFSLIRFNTSNFKYPIGWSCHNIKLYAMASEGKLWVLGDSSRSTLFNKASITYQKNKNKKMMTLFLFTLHSPFWCF